MTANPDQHYWHATTPPEWQNFDSPFELVASAPVPVASTIGTNPSEATSAVMATGLKRVMAP